MSDNNDNIKAILEEEAQRKERRRRAFKELLDEQREKGNHVFALKAKMGATDSYVTTASLAWIENHVKFAADLPIFKGKSDQKTKRVEVNEHTLELLQQRKPDWRRQLPMTEYLTRDNHKFPPLLVVGYQQWAYEDPKESDNWDSDGKAIRPSVPVMPLDSHEYFLDIDNKETIYYALDGQHRLMAILGLKELLQTSHLRDKKEDGKETKMTVGLDKIIELIIRRRKNLGDDNDDEAAVHNMLQGRMDEEMGIEIIPAVQKGETIKDAVSRLRQIFVDVNENARPPSKGDNILLDQNNGFRIIARYMMVSHDLLNKGKTSTKTTQLPEKSNCYTALSDLTNVAEEYLGQIRDSAYSFWKNDPVFGHKRFGYIRPPEEELDQGKIDLAVYFDALAKLPSHERFIQAAANDRNKLRTEDDNILFRPIAQSALAGAIGLILHNSEIPKEQFPNKLNKIFTTLAEQEIKGNLKLKKEDGPWYGVLCDASKKMRRHKHYKELCQTLFVHLLHGLENENLENLRNDFCSARQDASTAGHPINTDLPPPWNR